MDKRFIIPFIAPPIWDVEGYKLAPYCIKHILQLQAVGSPFVVGGVPMPQDVVLFLRICHKDNNDFTNIKPNWIDKALLMKMKISDNFYKSIVEQCILYITEYSQSPKIISTGSNGSKKFTNKEFFPELLTLIGLLITKTTITEQEALTMPYGKAIWYTAVIGVVEGADVRVLSTDEEESVDADKKKLKEYQRHIEEQFRLAMVNGKMPTRRINPKN